MRVSVEEYESTPALTVDWDLELAEVDERVQKVLQEKANKNG